MGEKKNSKHKVKNVSENNSIFYKSKAIPKHLREKNTICTLQIDAKNTIHKSFKLPLTNLQYLKDLLNKDSNKKPISSTLLKSIKMNWLFFTTIIGCSILYGSTWSTRLKMIITFIITGITGYFIHMFSHSFSYHHYYNTKSNIFREHKLIDKPVRFIIKWFLDFHHMIHHDSDINKKPIYIALEFFNNLWMEGGVIIIAILLSRMLSLEIIFIWMFIYSTVHNINYIINPCSQHQEHHKKFNTNFGTDYNDIIFGSKYDLGNLENYNHMSINIIVGFILLIVGRKYILPKIETLFGYKF